MPGNVVFHTERIQLNGIKTWLPEYWKMNVTGTVRCILQ